MQEVYQKEGKFLDTRVALCIHNIAFQGRFKSEIWPVLQLPDRLKPLFDFEDGIPRVCFCLLSMSLDVHPEVSMVLE